VAEVAIDEPRFPQDFDVAGVPPGRYFVLAIVDSDPEDGDRYRPSVDAGGAFGGIRRPQAVTVNLLGAENVDVALSDPRPDSPWSYGQ